MIFWRDRSTRACSIRERKPDVPVVPKRTADFIFIRYIGHPEIEFNSPYLQEWGISHPQLQDGADVYMFCHSPNNLRPLTCVERSTHRWKGKSLLRPCPGTNWRTMIMNRDSCFRH